MNVLVGGDARDRGLVHADRLGHVAQDHRLQVSHAAVEEVALLLDDALGDLDDGLAPLLDGPDQPLGVAELLADELLGRGILHQLLGQRFVDVQALHTLVVVQHPELVAVLHHVDVRGDADGSIVGVGEVARGPTLELLDLLGRLVDLLDRDLHLASDGLIVVLLEVVQVAVDDLGLDLVEADGLGLHQQALAQVAATNANRVEVLDQLQHVGSVFGVEPGFFGQIFDGQIWGARPVGSLDALQIQVALLVQVADDQLRKAAFSLGEITGRELPEQVIVQAARLGEVLLDGRQLVESAAVSGDRLLQAAVLEELLPVDLSDGLLALAGVGGLGRRALELRVCRLRLRALARIVAGAASLDVLVGQHRVVVELLPDLVDQLQPGELQQFDGLLQLRRHHQLLGQAELLLDFHGVSAGATPGLGPSMRESSRSPQKTSPPKGQPKYRRRTAGCSRNSPGPVTASTRPSSRSRTRSQNDSASPTRWSATSTAIWASARPRKMRPIRWAPVGSTPERGSSQSKTRGSASNARASSSRRRSPPERSRARTSRRVSSPTSWARATALDSLAPATRAKVAKFALTSRSKSTLGVCGMYPRPARARLQSGWRVTSRSPR